jgi:AcrR family transcriptional regulator
MSDDDPKPARGRPRTMNAEKVLDVAMTAYWQSDPADVSVNAICQMAGISKPSLYREFGSEDGLSRAVLDRYAEQVLSEVFVVLHGGQGLRRTLAALIDFASADPRMETGCLFYKMRAGKHRLGPETRARVEEIDAAAQAAYVAFLQAARDAGEWPDGLSVEAGAKYLGEQIALAITQRASGEDPERIREMLTPCGSVAAGSSRRSSRGCGRGGSGGRGWRR